MKRASLTPNRNTQEKHTAVDSVSATQLLKALHTLQNINIIQDQIDQDLNISFSQKDNFNQHAQNERSETSQSAQLSNRTKSKNVSNKENKENISKCGKMNFEFYMTKKESNINNKKHGPITSRPSISDQRNMMKNTTQLTYSKVNQNKISNHTNRTPVKTKSVSPLTQRSLNTSALLKTNNSIIANRQIRLKTQANDRQPLQPKRHIKANSTIVLPKQQKPIHKQISPPINMSLSTLNQTKQHAKTKLSQHLSSNPLHILSMHQRNKQFMRQKNEKLAKLCQQMEQKKKEQQKQCTFKPKIITNNSNIKSKYNDLTASRQFNDKSHKKCKIGKQNNQAQNCIDEYNKTLKCNKTQQLFNNQTEKLSFQDSISKLNEDPLINENDSLQSTKVPKSKYKNAKFNILLDLIH